MYKNSKKKLVSTSFQIYENYILKILLLILIFNESFINYFQQDYQQWNVMLLTLK